MGTWQKVLLGLVAVALLAVIILTWGSIGSAALASCLLLMGASLLYQRYLNNRDPDDYQGEA